MLPLPIKRTKCLTKGGLNLTVSHIHIYMFRNILNEGRSKKIPTTEDQLPYIERQFKRCHEVEIQIFFNLLSLGKLWVEIYHDYHKYEQLWANKKWLKKGLEILFSLISNVTKTLQKFWTFFQIKGLTEQCARITQFVVQTLINLGFYSSVFKAV